MTDYKLLYKKRSYINLIIVIIIIIIIIEVFKKFELGYLAGGFPLLQNLRIYPKIKFIVEISFWLFYGDV